MRFLNFRIGLSDHGPRFTPAEAKLPEEALALSDSESNSIALLNERGQRLAVPQGSGQSDLPWCVAEDLVDFLKLFRAKPSRPSGTLTFNQSGKAFIFKSAYPVLNGARRVAQQSRHLWASHSLSYKEYRMEPMVVARFLGTANFILQSKNDIRSIGYREWLHKPMKPHSCVMRNYLWRYV